MGVRFRTDQDHHRQQGAHHRQHGDGIVKAAPLKDDHQPAQQHNASNGVSRRRERAGPVGCVSLSQN